MMKQKIKTAIALVVLFMGASSLMFFSLAWFPDQTANAPPPGVLETALFRGFVVLGWAAWLMAIISNSPPPWLLFWCGIAISACSWTAAVFGVRQILSQRKRNGQPNTRSEATR
jgi:hypothetical protein